MAPLLPRASSTRRRAPRALAFAAVTLLVAVAVPARPGTAGEPRVASDLVGRRAWNVYFPFRLGDSWTYDWRTEGPLAPRGSTVRTRTFDGTSFINDSVGYKLLSDDGSHHLYTFESGVLAIHSSSEAGRLYYYDPPVVLAAPDLPIGEPRVVSQADGPRTWRTTVLGLESVSVPIGTFPNTLVVKLEMQAPDLVSTATHYFAPRVGLIAYKYRLEDVAGQRLMLGIDASLRLARLSGHTVARVEDLDRVRSGSEVASEDRGVREQLKRALERRYTWDAGFPGFRGEAQLVEAGAPPRRGRFTVGPDLSVRIEAGDPAVRAALLNEISAFVTQRKPAMFDLTYAETTFVKAGVRADGGLTITAAGDPLATTYTVKDGEIVEVSRSMGRVSYAARERSRLSTDDGRSITVEYDVAYTENQTGAEMALERTRDAYARLGNQWVPTSRRIERSEPGRPGTTRELTLSDLRLH